MNIVTRCCRCFCVLFVVLLFGCGGGGGGGGGGGVWNAGVGGKLYYDDPRDYVELDLRNGTVSVVRAGAAGAGATPSPDASEFAVIEGEDRFSEQVVLFRRNGNETGRIAPLDGNGRLTGFPVLSPRGDFIAITRGFGADTVVLDRNGVIQRNLGPDLGRQAWVSDQRLAYTRDAAVFIRDIGNGDEQQVARFGATPHSLAASPDGSRFALLLEEDGQPTLWTMDADGSRQRRLATSILDLSSPTWSPDGRHIAVRKGSAVSVPGVGGCPEVWAVPADAGGTVNLSAEDPAPAFRVQKVGEFSDQTGVCAFGPPQWR